MIGVTLFIYPHIHTFSVFLALLRDAPFFFRASTHPKPPAKQAASTSPVSTMADGYRDFIAGTVGGFSGKLFVLVGENALITLITRKKILTIILITLHNSLSQVN